MMTLPGVDQQAERDDQGQSELALRGRADPDPHVSQQQQRPLHAALLHRQEPPPAGKLPNFVIEKRCVHALFLLD